MFVIEPWVWVSLVYLMVENVDAEAPSARKDDASPSRPLSPPGGLMEQSDASLQRGRQG